MLVLVLVLVVVAVLALVVAVVVMVLMVPLVVLVVSRNASQVVCVSCIGYFDRSCYLVCGLVKGILSTCKVSGIAAARVHCFALTFVGHVCLTPRRRYFFILPTLTITARAGEGRKTPPQGVSPQEGGADGGQ